MSIAKQEKQVVMGEVSHDEAKRVMTSKQKEWNAGQVQSGIPDFEDSNRYSFKAKWSAVA